MAKTAENIQDMFLNKARKEGVAVTIHVMNGYQIKNALIRHYDTFVVIVEAEGQQMMIYKHAISSITPHKALELRKDNGKDEKPGTDAQDACAAHHKSL